jgi:DNA-binding NarL/FixJ family response regulator
MESLLVRVLVAEDFIPFRSFICLTVAARDNLQVICEVSDGLDAVHKTKELRPDLLLLDIGLPTLDGMSAGRQICKFSKSKIIFVTQESDADIAGRSAQIVHNMQCVQSCINTGYLASR